MSEEARYVVYATEDRNEYHVDGPDVVEERVTVTVLTLTELLGRVFEAGHQLGICELAEDAATRLTYVERLLLEEQKRVAACSEQLTVLVGELEEFEKPGWANLVRDLIRNAPQPFIVARVRDALKALDPDAEG